MLDLAVFVPRLKQVIAWTEFLMQRFAGQYDALDNRAIFRQINPIVDGQPLYRHVDNYIAWTIDEYRPDQFEQALQQALKLREELEKPIIEFANFQELGRILYLETQLTTHDGAPEFQSNGFVDIADIPPIDTWFYLDRNIKRQARKVPNLFCWIPKRFEPIMEETISVEIFDSYHWLDEAGPLTHQHIVAAMAE